MRLPFNRTQLLFLALIAVASVVAWFAGHDPSMILLGASIAPAISDADVSSMNTIAADLKEYYDQEKVYDLIWENNPELTLISKKDDVEGAYLAHAVKFGGSQGIAFGNYGNALGNQTPERYATFHVPMTPLYGIGTLKNQAIKAAKSRKGGFESLVEGAFRSALKNCANELSRAIMSNGSQTIGQIAAIQVNPANYPTGSAKVKLASSLSYQFFELGETLDITASEGSAPQGSPDTVTVLGVDAAAGILVLSAPTSGAWNAGYWVVGAYFIRDGNYNPNQFSAAISTQTGIDGYQPSQFAGMGAWCPSYAYRQNPGLAAGTFFNVPRNLDGTRLAGLGIDQSTVQIDKALIYAAVQTGIYSDGAEYCSLNPDSYNALLQLLQGQKLYEDVEVTANIAYKLLVIHGGPKPLKVINSRNVPPKTAFLWSPNDFSLASQGPMPEMMPYGDMEFLPLPDDDANQFRAGGYGNVVLNNPPGVAQVALQQ